MFIGLGVGDIYTGITLLRNSLQALSNSKGSQKEYIDAAYQLETLEICLKVAQCKLLDLESGDSRDVLARAITECAKCIDGYQREIGKYESYFREGAEHHGSFRRKCLKELKKIQWLYEKEKTEALSKTIASHVQIITLACSIGSLPPPRSEATTASLSQTILSEELTKVLHPSSRIPAFAPRNPRWDLETQLDASSITSTMALEKGRKRNVADDQQRVFLINNSSDITLNRRVVVLPASTSSSPSASSKNVSTSPTRAEMEAALVSDDVLVVTPVTSTGDPVSFEPTTDTLSRTTTATTGIVSNSSTASPSIFSRRPSESTSISLSLTTPTTNISCPSNASTISELRVQTNNNNNPNTAMMSWVDDHGVCHNPSCQQRSFLQKKAFTVYAHLMHTGTQKRRRGRGRERELAAEPTQLPLVRPKPEPTCEHSLLFYQAGAAAAAAAVPRGLLGEGGNSGCIASI